MGWNLQFERLKQGEQSIQEYNDEFQRLKDKVDPTAAWPVDMTIRKYIGGLRPELATWVYGRNPLNLATAMSMAERYYTGQQLASIPTADVGLIQEINQLREQVNKLNQQPIQFMQQNTLPPLNQQFQQPIQTPNLGCHKCGEKGHKRAQ